MSTFRFEDDFEHITKDEFEIGSPKNYGKKDSGYDDVEGNLVKVLNEKYPFEEYGFKFEEARAGTDAIKITSPDGTPTTITLNSSWNGFNKNPQAYNQVMSVLKSNVNPEQKKVFEKTNLSPDDNGEYDLQILDKSDDKRTVKAKKKITFPHEDYINPDVEVDNWKDKANKEEVLTIASDMEGELTRALTSVDPTGEFVVYPGLEQRASRYRIDFLTPENEKNIREAVFKQVNLKGDYKISQRSFNKIWDRGLYKRVIKKVSDKQKIDKNIFNLSKTDLNEDFNLEQQNEYHKKLKGKDVYK